LKSLKTAAIIIILFSFVFSAFGVNAGAQNIDIPLTDNYNEEKNWGIY